MSTAEPFFDQRTTSITNFKHNIHGLMDLFLVKDPNGSVACGVIWEKIWSVLRHLEIKHTHQNITLVKQFIRDYGCKEVHNGKNRTHVYRGVTLRK